MALATTSLWPSGPIEEHAGLQAVLEKLQQAALAGGASAAMFLPSPRIQYEAWSFSYYTGLCKEMNVLGVNGGATITGHIAINISGHAGSGRAEQLAALVLAKMESHSVARASLDVLKAAREAGPGDLRWKLDAGELRVTAAEVSAFGATDEGKQAADDVRRRAFALTNTYNVRVILPDGQRLELRNVERNNADAVEYATKIPIEFPARRGTTVIEAWPTGSAEVAGYVEARRYRMHIGAENFYSEATGIAVAERYMDAHPQVRWAARAKDPKSAAAADDEEADRARGGVRPLPLPYTDAP